MHPSRSRSRAVSAVITLTLLLIYYFTLLPIVTVGSSDDAGYGQRKMALGSRPPSCINKCLACKPCLPTLVVQGHQVVKTTLSSREDDDGYYLLAWKCRCGNKVFQP